MKKSVLITFILLFLITSCHRKKDCQDNISIYLTKIPYSNKNIVTFYNDTLGEKNDTIYIKLNNVYNNNYYSSDYASDVCGASIKVKYSNTYGYDIYQFSNAEANHIEEYLGPHETFYKDTLINFKNTVYFGYIFYLDRDYLDSIYANLWTDEYKSADGTLLYNDFIVIDSPYYKLVEYTTLDKEGHKRKWKLQE